MAENDRLREVLRDWIDRHIRHRGEKAMTITVKKKGQIIAQRVIWYRSDY